MVKVIEERIVDILGIKIKCIREEFDSGQERFARCGRCCFQNKWLCDNLPCSRNSVNAIHYEIVTENK